MQYHIMTLFPSIIDSYMNESMMKKAEDKGNINYKVWNIRDYSINKHKKVDDYPYGGGAGMVMTPQPIISCYEDIIMQNKTSTNKFSRAKVIYCSPKGKVFNNELAKTLANEESLIFLCGHYEGVDQRVIDLIVDEEISIGDYVLTGGELASLVMIDSISRHIKGVLGQQGSLEEESFTNNLLEYPHYTRPEIFNNLKVPEILLSGHHKNINTWRKIESIKITFKRRPDIIKYDYLSEEDKKIINNLKNIDK